MIINATFYVGLNRHTQLLLPPALKVAKSDFEPRIDKQLANDQGSCDSRGVLFLSLASCSAIHGSKSDFATFNAGGKNNCVYLLFPAFEEVSLNQQASKTFEPESPSEGFVSYKV